MRQLKIAHKITNRESAALDKYLNEIGKISMLTPEEEVRLAQRIREGNQDALDEMTRANLRFVVSVAKQYQNQGLSLSDLINEGNVGLIKAAKRFDETKGFKFISYAVWWIRQSILQAIVENSRIVRMPLNKVGSYSKVNEAYISFVQQFERDPAGAAFSTSSRSVGPASPAANAARDRYPASGRPTGCRRSARRPKSRRAGTPQPRQR